jgi:hypothetical protein
MRIDETGRDHMASSIDLFFAGAEIFSNGGDLFALDGDIGFEPGASGSIDY